MDTIPVKLLQYGPDNSWTCSRHGKYYGAVCPACQNNVPEGAMQNDPGDETPMTPLTTFTTPFAQAVKRGEFTEKARLATDAKARKDAPMARGLLDYFPKACAYVAYISKIGNDQHNPGEPMHWAREKSTDHADCIVRHLVDRGLLDSDGTRHAGKVAWRALALLETELEEAGE